MKEKIETIKKEVNIKKDNKLELDKCSTAAHPEMARNNHEDEPCDDN